MKSLLLMLGLTLLYSYAGAVTPPSQIVMTYDNGVEATYNFTRMTSDTTTVLSDIQYYRDITYILEASPANGRIASFTDLGAMACKDIPNQNVGPGLPLTETDRKDRPYLWLAYSDVWSSIASNQKTPKISPQVGHCYVYTSTDMRGRLVVAFHVDNIKNESFTSNLTLSEIEVFLNLEWAYPAN